jgi:hypothetical protein
MAAAILVLATAGPVAAQDRAPPPPVVLSAAHPTEIVAVMLAEGYQAKLVADATADPRIDSAAAGSRFTVQFGGCDKGRDCRTLRFVAWWERSEHVTDAIGNRWNREHRFVRAAIDAEDDVMLDYEFSKLGGMLAANFRDVLGLWSEMVGVFMRFIGQAPDGDGIDGVLPIRAAAR